MGLLKNDRQTSVEMALSKRDRKKVWINSVHIRKLAELMGSETYLHLKAGGYSLTARVNPRSTARAGDTIKLAFDPNKLYFFDKTTQETLLNR